MLKARILIAQLLIFWPETIFFISQVSNETRTIFLVSLVWFETRNIFFISQVSIENWNSFFLSQVSFENWNIFFLSKVSFENQNIFSLLIFFSQTTNTKKIFSQMIVWHQIYASFSRAIFFFKNRVSDDARPNTDFAPKKIEQKYLNDSAYVSWSSKALSAKEGNLFNSL